MTAIVEERAAAGELCSPRGTGRLVMSCLDAPGIIASVAGPAAS